MNGDGALGERLAAARAENSPYELPAFVANISLPVGEVAGRQVWATVCLVRRGWFELRFRVPPGNAELATFEPVRLWAEGLTAGIGGEEAQGAFQSGGGGGVGRSTTWTADVAFVPGFATRDFLRLHHGDAEVELELRGADRQATVVDMAEGPARAGEGGCKRCHFPNLGRTDGFCAQCRVTVDQVVGAYSRPFAPTRSLSLMTDLGEVLGARTTLVALEAFDTWFNIRCTQSWSPSMTARSLDDFEIGGRWLASDDRGGSYEGFGNGASTEYDRERGSRGMTQELSFAPGLNPEATRLRLMLPVANAPDRLRVELAL
jgi:hypothetical protein